MTRIFAKLKPKDGFLEVDSDPKGANVYVDGELKGQTPLTIQLPPKGYSIKLTKDGYHDYAIAVTVEPGQATRISARLEVVPTPIVYTWMAAILFPAALAIIILAC